MFKIFYLFLFLVIAACGKESSDDKDPVRTAPPVGREDENRDEDSLAAIAHLTSEMREMASTDLSCQKSSDCRIFSLQNTCASPKDFVVTTIRNNNYLEIRYLARKIKSRNTTIDSAVCENGQFPLGKCLNLKCQ
ncbi:MAG: hypothetical protein H0V66_05565 [Bdellovibrionales bacterium]|nr:hypothetical protein [Bdellovibrionales bacterium]